MQKFKSVEELVNQLRPDKPVYCIRKKSILSASKFFQKNFPGKILYAVKTNPHPEVIKTLLKSGINQFDVASVEEIKAVRKFDQVSKCSFMHTIKSREDISEAYFKYGVKTFALDTKDELIKIIESTSNAKDLELFVRVAVSNEHAEIDLSKKFGAINSEAAGLLRLVKQHSKKIGLSFHVGSQCMNPNSYAIAIQRVGDLIRSSGIMLDILDVGGGFPSRYIDMNPPPLDTYIEEITAALIEIPIREDCEIWAEPGRGLVAEAASTVVRIDHRKDNYLYINDGIYGSLFDAGLSAFIHPVRPINIQSKLSDELVPFSFFGPTCDGMDFMKGPYMLPNTITEGDYIEIGQTGAYGCTMRTKFNGFYSDETILLNDHPILSLYGCTNMIGETVDEVAL